MEVWGEAQVEFCSTGSDVGTHWHDNAPAVAFFEEGGEKFAVSIFDLYDEDGNHPDWEEVGLNWNSIGDEFLSKIHVGDYEIAG
jgi:hypothetical protein